MEERRGAYRVTLGKPEGKKQFGRPRRKWQDNIKKNLKLVRMALVGLIWLRMGTDVGLLWSR
jgi:hypothetical protein